MSKGKTKKRVAFIIAFSVLMTTLTCWNVGQAFAATTGIVNDGPLIVRSGAGTNYSRLGTLAKGKTITIKATKKDSKGKTWYQITYNSRKGYVSGQYVTLKTASSSKTYSPTKTGVVKEGPLNVRSNAGTGYKSLGKLLKGKTVTLKGEKKDSKGKKWYRITYSGKTGYIMATYVTVKSSTATSGSKTYSPTKTGVVKEGPLNVRSNAGTGYKSLGKLLKGKTVTLKGEKKDSKGKKWYRITYSGKTGYIISTYVTVKSSNSTSGSKTYSPTKTGVIKATSLNVRSNAGAGYKLLGKLSKGKTVTLKGERKDSKGNKWYKITYNAKTGYIFADYVTLKTSSSVTVTINNAAIVKNGPLNVRSGAGTSYSKIGSLSKGESLTLKKKVTNTKKEVWYAFAYTSQKTGYVLGEYLSISNSSTPQGSNLSSTEFEKWMTDQGFPSSYKAKLRSLHKEHPKWIFRAQNTGLTWSTMLAKEMRLGNNLVEPTSPTSWKSKAAGAYKNGKYTVFDGRWNAASEAITKYYLDPRNFLNDEYIYQFMDHSFDAKSQTKSTIKSLVTKSECFMNTTAYINALYNAGSKARVNPNVITAMVIMEQGWKGGTGLISGNYPGYKGYYNHFNIGAYTTSTMSATQRGLWWAKGAGTGDTTYSRPWNSIEKSLTGGADYYASNYTRKNQNTYYTKKFNVMNGASNVATHEYMTNVSGGASEGKLLSYAYRNDDDFPIVFHIPVYKSMPSSACSKPS